ncbi:hypothetical protein [Herbaspirillum sp. YR522]|uniref:hypothetical protein n=1 Tax=Herbaspirillum sp. YR522 TaxID=1144342 RepID=UPI00026F76FF|nr:hypothetical protein [Herbaspirillum sp. YR522]EJM98523.1 hypothetical protein PMI40_03984 [Herbaspirillum sp. YR522]
MRDSMEKIEDTSDLQRCLALMAETTGMLDLPEAQDVPDQPLPELPRAELGLRPPSREALLALPGDTLGVFRDQAQHGFTDIMGQALQWMPSRASRTGTQSLQMGNAIELRDMMSASRRSLAGGGNDERRTMARELCIASATNLVQPGWDPADAGTYATLAQAGEHNLLLNLLTS